jgi:dipeptidyl aminopeptidase/acylaminoacyl peptidase
MARIRTWAVASAALALAAGARAAPLEAYGQLPGIQDAAISPDGALAAVLVSDGVKNRVLIFTMDDLKALQAINAGEAKVRSIQWAGSGHLLVTASITGDIPDVIAPRSEWYVVEDFNLKSRTFTNVLASASDAIRAVIGSPSVRMIAGHAHAFVQAYHFVDAEGCISLFDVDLDRRSVRLVVDGDVNTDAWLVDADGQPLARSEYDASAGQWRLKVKRKVGWVVAAAQQSRFGDGGVLGLGRDGRSVLASTEKDSVDAARELPPGSMAWSEPFAVEDNEEFIFDSVDERLIGTHALVGDVDHYDFFSALDGAIWAGTVKAFAGQRVTPVSFSADHKRSIVLVDSPSLGPAYAIVDVAARQARYLGPVYDELKAEDIAPVTAIAFKAKDGRALSGYLTLPRGRDPKGLPLIVYPHGGPAARDAPGFDWWAQAMASRGYAVLQVNYRGSDGFGWDFLSAGFGEWGHKMQTDLSDGVRYLAGQGTVDPKRVCIVGASYGGYAALAGATLDPDVYRCAVSVGGISDLRRFVAWSKNTSNVTAERYWTRYMGADGLKDPHLEEISPAQQAQKATAPILLIHGKDDTVVPFEQSRIMADAMTKAGKPVELLPLKGEDHWLSRGETRLEMLRATMEFVEKNNPPS